ncbi:MAG: hypothetical protein ACK5MK_14895 [Dysgonomonas sp.]
MSNLSFENELVSKICDSCDTSVSFLEQNFRKLSPAGKFQTCILTAAIIISDSHEQIISRGEGTMDLILKNMIPQFLSYFGKYKNMYVSSQNVMSITNTAQFNEFIIKGNNILLSDNEKVVTSLVLDGLSHFWSELQKIERDGGYDEYDNLMIPQKIYYSLYICPFFISYIPNDEKENFMKNIDLALMRFEAMNRDSPTTIDFVFTLWGLLEAIKE